MTFDVVDNIWKLLDGVKMIFKENMVAGRIVLWRLMMIYFDGKGLFVKEKMFVMFTSCGTKLKVENNNFGTRKWGSRVQGAEW